MMYLHGVSKKFSEWYQKTKKTEDTNRLTLLAFKIITILHNTLAEPLSHVLGLPRLQHLAPFMMFFRWGNRKKSTVLP
jgi:hypothetical protein